LHSIVRDRRDHLLDRLRTSASFLEALIAHYRSKGIHIVTLDEALARLELPAPEPFVCFTFDDGYRDNLRLALPIFERYDCPLTIFVTTCFVDRSMNVWWAGLAELVKRKDAIDVPALGRTLDTSTFHNKVRAYRSLCAAVNTDALSAEVVSDLLRKHGISTEAILDKDALTETELREMGKSELVAIGAHTHSHPQLAHLSLTDARREITANKQWLEEITGREVHHFAYPYGDSASCGEREFTLVRDIGFRSGLTTRIGNLRRKHASYPTELPRLRPFNEHESIRLLEFQRSGAANTVAAFFGGGANTG
jgi:peptidoglycan/xylan/chitin deacetylase (PgdA/CDA1 family)